jgi:hypothetical protein
MIVSTSSSLALFKVSSTSGCTQQPRLGTLSRTCLFNLYYAKRTAGMVHISSLPSAKSPTFPEKDGTEAVY